MTYDYYGAWSSTTGANSPLYTCDAGSDSIDATVKRWIAAVRPRLPSSRLPRSQGLTCLDVQGFPACQIVLVRRSSLVSNKSTFLTRPSLFFSCTCRASPRTRSGGRPPRRTSRRPASTASRRRRSRRSRQRASPTTSGRRQRSWSRRSSSARTSRRARAATPATSTSAPRVRPSRPAPHPLVLVVFVVARGPSGLTSSPSSRSAVPLQPCRQPQALRHVRGRPELGRQGRVRQSQRSRRRRASLLSLSLALSRRSFLPSPLSKLLHHLSLH